MFVVHTVEAESQQSNVHANGAPHDPFQDGFVRFPSCPSVLQLHESVKKMKANLERKKIEDNIVKIGQKLQIGLWTELDKIEKLDKIES